jgi:outer membrane protein assembly factor BamB
MRTATLLLCGLLLATTSTSAENWPGWRGPRGDGTSAEENVPTHWNGTSGENIAWKVDVPGDGHASPVVWDDRIFLVSCLPESQERVLLCLDRRTGATLWARTVVTSPLETLHKLNSRASGTPATDGRLVYVNFLEVDGTTIPAPNVGAPRPITPGRVVVAAYDLGGNRQWITRVGEFISAHGFCSCPVLYEDLVIINGDHDGKSYITALHKETGETAWNVPRANGIRSYVTPLIRTVGGRTQMVLSGSKHIASLDPRDGSTLWTVDGPTEQFVASMVFDGERFFMAAGFPDYHVMAIRGEGSGDVTHSQVAWHSTEAHCYVPSPVVTGGYLLVANDDGIAHCYQADTGEHLWRTRLGRHYSASLVTSGGLVYFTDDDGVTKLIRPGKELEVVEENSLEESCFASPAISQGQLFIRSEHHLFCIGPPAGT